MTKRPCRSATKWLRLDAYRPKQQMSGHLGSGYSMIK